MQSRQKIWAAQQRQSYSRAISQHVRAGWFRAGQSLPLLHSITSQHAWTRGWIILHLLHRFQKKHRFRGSGSRRPHPEVQSMTCEANRISLLGTAINRRRKTKENFFAAGCLLRSTFAFPAAVAGKTSSTPFRSIRTASRWMPAHTFRHAVLNGAGPSMEKSGRSCAMPRQ